MPTVKFRPDQPLFKADAFRMPLWIHAPFEIMRGIVKWLTVSLVKDNPHRNVRHNATFTRGAKAAHRNAFWTGKPVVKRPKWVTMLWRWGMVFTVAAMVKYAPGEWWLWLARCLGRVLAWVGLDVIPAMWANLWLVPFVVIGLVLGLYLVAWAVRTTANNVRGRVQDTDDDGEHWYAPMFHIDAKVRAFFKGKGEYR